jgi:hypothetical protein
MVMVADAIPGLKSWIGARWDWPDQRVRVLKRTRLAAAPFVLSSVVPADRTDELGRSAAEPNLVSARG